MTPDDDRGHSAVETSTERIVRIPEAAPPAAPPARGPTRPPVITRSRTAWIVAFALFLVAALSLFLILLAPDDDAAPGTGQAAGATIADGGEAPLAPSAGTALALETPGDLRTQTVNAAGDNDLLALSESGVGSIAQYDGAPVTADGVTVGTAFSDTVFTVTSPAGGELVVLVPYTVGTRDLLVLAENEEIVFNGTLMPVPDDLSEVIGTEAGAVAARTGSYIVAVPENIRVIPANDEQLVN